MIRAFFKGRAAAIDQVLHPARKFESGKEVFHQDEYMSMYIEASWSKITKYYNKTDRASANVATMLLNPVHNWSYLNRIGNLSGLMGANTTAIILGNLISLFHGVWL